MPKRIAETDPGKQIDEFVGSGPFIFKKDEWKPGDRTVYVRNPDYKPRAEPPSGLAGGKVAKVDRVEWLAIPDHQTAVNALLAGEIDYIEAPPHDLKSLLLADKNVRLEVYNTIGAQYVFRWNTVVPPFNNERVRRAAMYAFNQKDFLKGVIGDDEYYRTCDAMFVCGTPLENSAGMDGLVRRQLRQVEGAAEGGGLRRHADRHAAHDRHRRADQCRADRQVAARAGRLQGRRWCRSTSRPSWRAGCARRRRPTAAGTAS